MNSLLETHFSAYSTMPATSDSLIPLIGTCHSLLLFLLFLLFLILLLLLLLLLLLALLSLSLLLYDGTE
jgi:hypothetical protein